MRHRQMTHTELLSGTSVIRGSHSRAMLRSQAQCELPLGAELCPLKIHEVLTPRTSEYHPLGTFREAN